MAIEKTLFIIKPEAFDKREEIKDYVVKHSDLKIIDSKILTLNEKDVECIYVDDLGTNLSLAAKKHLKNKVVEVCIAEGKSAVEVMWDLTGKNFNGNKCKPFTLRYIFGRLGTVQYDDVTYYLNAIHKTTPLEVNSALKWFKKKSNLFTLHLVLQRM